MNPEDEEQLTIRFDDMFESYKKEDEGYTSISGMDLDTDSFYKNLGIDDVEEDEGHNKINEVNTRLQRIEKVLGIPADLERNKEIEEKHPHIKAMAEAYELEVEKHITLELLTPPEPEEFVDDIPF